MVGVTTHNSVEFPALQRQTPAAALFDCSTVVLKTCLISYFGWKREFGPLGALQGQILGPFETVNGIV